MIFKLDIIRKLIHDSDPLVQTLQKTYSLLPPTRCQRRTHCCSMLPEMTLAEALAGIRRVIDMPSAVREQLMQSIARYFFTNPVEILLCPFLKDAACLIYDHRFLGCRAYGLWSKSYYETLVHQNRQSKKALQEQWKNLGVSLPQTIIDFRVPYCRNVETVGSDSIDDSVLLQVEEAIDTISVRLSPWHQLFGQRYFSDFSFLLTSLALGFQDSIQMKFSIVRDIINSGNRAKLDRAINELPDLFVHLTRGEFE
ncbi:YkgJ family cysteine cluster protein [Thermodesulfobacteriota bacterium]